MKAPLLLILVAAVTAQVIVPATTKRFFKYSTAGNLTAINKKLNATATAALCNSTCTAFGNSKSFLAAGAKPGTDPLGKPANAILACRAFCNHWFSCKKYINYMFTQLGTKWFTIPEGKKLKDLYWVINKNVSNNFNQSIAAYMPQAMSKVTPANQPAVAKALQAGAASFVQANPQDGKNVFQYVLP